jgi:type IV pilus assembly protein PilB
MSQNIGVPQFNNSQLQQNSPSSVSMAQPIMNQSNQPQQTQGGQVNFPQTNLLNDNQPISSFVPSAQQGIVSVRGDDIITALLKRSLVSQSDLNDIKPVALAENKPIEHVLIERGKVPEATLFGLKAETNGYKFIDLTAVDISVDVLGKISKDVAQKNMAVPFGEEDGKVKVAITDPGDLQKVKFLQVVIGKPVEYYVAMPSQIQSVIDKQYAGQINSEVKEALEDVGDVIDVSSSRSSSLQSEDVSSSNLESAPVSRIVNMIMEYAAKYQASDVHIEPRENKVVVRFRISGVLVEKLTLPQKLSNAVVARIKVLSSLKLDEHRLPQDGRFQVKSGTMVFDIRVSIIPSVYGEKVVMRLLAQGGGEFGLEESGLRGFAHKLYVEALKRTEGVILVTGPTGSGKTHTLASSLKIRNEPGVNILTLEDPVEIRIEGVTQVQVKSEIGLTFAAGLRAFLRQDPDIIMVGEIRDSETANLAVQAALTGHLVLATLHTNSSSGAIPRLLDMGIEPFLLSSTINAILAQRLVRKICPDCVGSYNALEEEVAKLHKELDGLNGFDLYSYPPRKDDQGQIITNQSQNKEVVLHKGNGCNKCGGTGYKGRIGIFEVLNVTEKIGQMIMQKRSAFEIEKQAVEDGMIKMIQDGFLKALEGVTTMQEVLRVIS